jgi:hypothetical protein
MLRLMIDTKQERIEDYALRAMTSTPNVDPADVMVAREDAVGRLEEYLRHVALHKATSIVESAFRIESVRTLGRVS